MSAAAGSNPRVGIPGEERPLYGLPHDVQCLRSMVPWQRTVQSSTGPTPQGTMTIESTEAGLDHRRDAQSVRVVTVIPAGSLSPDALFDREQASIPRRRGSVRHGFQPRVAGPPRPRDPRGRGPGRFRRL
jgi:hypothetical protein